MHPRWKKEMIGKDKQRGKRRVNERKRAEICHQHLGISKCSTANLNTMESGKGDGGGSALTLKSG